LHGDVPSDGRDGDTLKPALGGRQSSQSRKSSPDDDDDDDDELDRFQFHAGAGLLSRRSYAD
jgi:hypothetical protein